MARRPRDAQLETRDARKRLKPRKEPYWRQIYKGLALGYYRGKMTGSWHIRRINDDGRKVYQRIGKADDYADADGKTILDYGQAVRMTMAEDRAGPATPEGKYTVNDAVRDYLEDLNARSPRGYHDAELRFDHHVKAKLGKRTVASVTREQLRRWHQAIANTNGNDDPEAVRKRQNTANRNLSALKAALNFAYHEGKVVDRSAWESVKSFRNVNAPRVRFLSVPEVRKLVKNLPGPVGYLALASALTGARYGELRNVCVGDYDPIAQTITFAQTQTKSAKTRHVPLTDEGVRLLDTLTAGRQRDDLIFTREDGRPWRKSEQSRPMRQACVDAKIVPPVGFHILRHTYGSLLARKGVSLQVIAKAMGHADSRMTEKHYAHLQPDHVAREVRKHLPTFQRKRGKVRRLG